MARPDYYPDWATLDTTLPATGKINKQRPKQEIREIGWDKGQIPTAEEFNWQMNNYGRWVHYFADEVLPTLPTTYLPLNGTRINFTGDLTGNASFIGNSVITASIEVRDNSHLHISANISDATPSAVPNTVVKRGAGAQAAFGDIQCCSTTNNDAATIFFQNVVGEKSGDISSSPGAGGSLTMARVNPTTQAYTSSVSLSDNGYVGISLPRSISSQETQGNSLVRYDYLRTEINAVNNKIDQLKFSSAFRSNPGWYKDENTGIIYQWGFGAWKREDETAESINFPIAFPSTCLMVIASCQSRSAAQRADFWGQAVSWNRTTGTFSLQTSGNDNWNVDGRITYWAIGY